MDSFAARHLGLRPSERAQLLQSLGQDQDQALLPRALPAGLLTPATDLGPAMDQTEVLQALKQLAAQNHPAHSMIGLGFYSTATPAVIQRGVLENPSWYTAYTPYQPEISQGRLEALFVFQTMISELTGLPLAGASLLDEGSAAAEAMSLCHRAARGRRLRFAIDIDLFPQVKAVLETRAEPLGIELVLFDPATHQVPEDVSGALVQYQGTSGRLVDLEPLASAAHQAGALLVVAADPLALALLRAPGSAGADVCYGSTQRFGLPMGYGGPHAAYLAVSQALARQLPGRLVGQTVDAAGQVAYRLALVTREQHIRREKATSNICTAQVLIAVMAAMFGVWHGPEGLKRIATEVHAKAGCLAEALTGIGQKPQNLAFFDTLSLSLPGQAQAFQAAARRHGVLIWASQDEALISADELTSQADLEAVLAAAAEVLGLDQAPSLPQWTDYLATESVALPAEVRRDDRFMEQAVFGDHQGELAMMRYLKVLSDQDYALDRGLIPLGSCTMKLSSAIEMAAISWPEFASLHPFGPVDDAAGSLELMRQLSHDLTALTGYDAISLAPNAGSQGELAGLLAIRRFHQSRGEDRPVCLIPVSAHGTNAASAALAGFEVVQVGADAGGNVSLEDLRGKLAGNEGRVGALMITYPSTHGVFEESVVEVCDLVHQAGGQVYIDGANFNALVGWAKAGLFGGDVSHLNLHKTFGMPHGGGGPGVGPVVARSHLAPYLPGHSMVDVALGGAPSGLNQGAVTAAPFGSALLLPISWAYIKLLGGDGLSQASEDAVLAANYVAAQLEDVFDVLYRGPGGWVAHECILDLHGFTARTGVTVDDVAKRLMDYGIHAPTMSFPVAGSLMVEPTESEPLSELDRFIAAMRAIADEAEQVAAGVWPLEDSPLRHAPHTAAQVSADSWQRPYPRSLAAYPTGQTRAKYWPPVGRIDGAYGDRNLVAKLDQ
ncbi:MAG: aminomethyl-transferring glycine dehydrogenase [Micrococcales bacterium]|nr:aminomethyl-transferring glycine dehydrogenase [Micrococcales bacterium]